MLLLVEELYMQSYYYFDCITLKLFEFPQASLQTPVTQNRKLGRSDKTKKVLVRKNENNSFSPRSCQINNSSLLVDRILNALWSRYQELILDDPKINLHYVRIKII